MKINELPIAVTGKTIAVSFEATQVVGNPAGSIELYGKTADGGEVRLLVSAEAAGELDVDLT